MKLIINNMIPESIKWPNDRMKPRWKAGNLIVIGGLLAVLMIFWDRILVVLSRFMGTAEISSRSMRLLSDGNAILASPSRMGILQTSFDILNQSPIIGWGAESAQNLVGAYPHDIFVELLFSFGYPLGICACALMIVVAIRGLMQRDSWDREASILFLSCLCFVNNKSLKSEEKFPVFVS